MKANSIPLDPGSAITSLNTTGSNSRNASGIFIHVSSGDSQENIAYQSEFTYADGHELQTNNTLGKRVTKVIDCGVSRFYYTGTSYCNVDSRVPREWIAMCYSRATGAGFFHRGTCDPDQDCQDNFGRAQYGDPLAGCVDRKSRTDTEPERIEPVTDLLGRVKNAPPVQHPNTITASLTDKSSAPVKAKWMYARVLGAKFDDFGNPLTVPLHKGYRCFECSMLTMRDIPKEATTELFDVKYENGITFSHITWTTSA